MILGRSHGTIPLKKWLFPPETEAMEKHPGAVWKCVLIVDQSTQLILEADKACEMVFGLPAERLVGRALFHWVGDSARNDFMNALSVIARGSVARTFQVTLRTVTAEPVSAEVIAAPCLEKHGRSAVQVTAQSMGLHHDAKFSA